MMSVSVFALIAALQTAAPAGSLEEAAECGWALSREAGLAEGSAREPYLAARDAWGAELSSRAVATGMQPEATHAVIASERALIVNRIAADGNAVSSLAGWCRDNQPGN
ncbi:hypothetical protein [Maricaulis sp.]|uniref:hypothetical protein n=1 Tax=Maricaulis sp. TaxID=1486257 RepID=UPI00263301A8|nr:hypothetical protein [Maricaulis sp.]